MLKITPGIQFLNHPGLLSKGRTGGARGGQSQAGNPMQRSAETKKAF